MTMIAIVSDPNEAARELTLARREGADAEAAPALTPSRREGARSSRSYAVDNGEIVAAAFVELVDRGSRSKLRREFPSPTPPHRFHTLLNTDHHQTLLLLLLTCFLSV